MAEHMDINVPQQCKWDCRLRVHDAEILGIMPGLRQYYIDKGFLTEADFDIPLAEFARGNRYA